MKKITFEEVERLRDEAGLLIVEMGSDGIRYERRPGGSRRPQTVEPAQDMKTGDECKDVESWLPGNPFSDVTAAQEGGVTDIGGVPTHLPRDLWDDIVGWDKSAGEEDAVETPTVNKGLDLWARTEREIYMRSGSTVDLEALPSDVKTQIEILYGAAFSAEKLAPDSVRGFSLLSCITRLMQYQMLDTIALGLSSAECVPACPPAGNPEFLNQPLRLGYKHAWYSSQKATRFGWCEYDSDNGRLPVTEVNSKPRPFCKWEDAVYIGLVKERSNVTEHGNRDRETYSMHRSMPPHTNLSTWCNPPIEAFLDKDLMPRRLVNKIATTPMESMEPMETNKYAKWFKDHFDAYASKTVKPADD